MDAVIEHLEVEVRKLIKQCEYLTEMNVKLRQSKAQLTQEKEILLTKHKTAIAQIETMVSRLKSLEKPPQ